MMNGNLLKTRSVRTAAVCFALMFALCGCGDGFELLLPYKKPVYAPYEDEDEEEEEEWEFEELEEDDEEDEEDYEGDFDDEEDYDEESAEAEPGEEPPPVFTPGVLSGNSYENSTLGIGLTMGDGWTFSTPDELAKINNLGEAATTETATAFLEKPEEYVDMDVISGGYGNEISVSVINSMFIASEDMRQVAEDTNAALEEQLTKGGYQDVTVSVEERQFLGEIVYANVAYCTYQGTQVREMQIHSQKNGYFYTITFMFFGDNDFEEVMGNFYSVEGESV